ncbi:hypothetical protein C0585_04925 [Candidatus Woesearchaeota archaeon]|nr:MAG: hypothetical protein C0585_04925 [Candidatus Woesearchaeota archaeon]
MAIHAYVLKKDVDFLRENNFLIRGRAGHTASDRFKNELDKEIFQATISDIDNFDKLRSRFTLVELIDNEGFIDIKGDNKYRDMLDMHNNIVPGYKKYTSNPKPSLLISTNQKEIPIYANLNKQNTIVQRIFHAYLISLSRDENSKPLLIYEKGTW